ncbi:MAG: methyltransferase domain-containing protein [Melioribacteraceae bacterium]|nr:methyltransferase domain-containing protein [Melioribacteraceae bacterium]MCF8356145.1 methyltransferase domain-containing protein [Melioribacteraceae bacterium]MCF8395625.1 methyltransferase domain-containing protein [Melioribacteraceae bacterium]MCF8420876.1 methyltransferase domain-containing protein [Melioribacteraceae bacterium]
MNNNPDYSNISPTYNKRYQVNPLFGIQKYLIDLVVKENPQTVLEVGCGTAYWISIIEKLIKHSIGLDLSTGMLKEGKKSSKNISFVNGNAECIPFHNKSCDLIYCVNMIHQVGDKTRYITSAFEKLKTDGIFVIIGTDPMEKNDEWFIHKFFDGTYELDKKRFPSWNYLIDQFNTACFSELDLQTLEIIESRQVGKEIFDNYFIQKDSGSQLAMLDDYEYHKGINKIEQCVKNNPRYEFATKITMKALSGRK